jgi:hypothetical protein
VALVGRGATLLIDGCVDPGAGHHALAHRGLCPLPSDLAGTNNDGQVWPAGNGQPGLLPLLRSLPGDNPWPRLRIPVLNARPHGEVARLPRAVRARVGLRRSRRRPATEWGARSPVGDIRSGKLAAGERPVGRTTSGPPAGARALPETARRTPDATAGDRPRTTAGNRPAKCPTEGPAADGHAPATEKPARTGRRGRGTAAGTSLLAGPVSRLWRGNWVEYPGGRLVHLLGQVRQLQR